MNEIRVLQHNITSAFERAVGVGAADNISSGLVHPGIDCIVDHQQMQTPFADTSTGKIVVGEVYFSYLWAVLFSMLVIFEEGVRKRLPTGEYQGRVNFDTPLLQAARTLYRWALTLKFHASAWPGGAPTPSMASSGDLQGEYCAKANAVFEDATSYVLCHEYAHLITGHSETIRSLRAKPAQLLTAEERVRGKQLENEADNFARECLQPSGGSHLREQQRAIAIILVHCADLLSLKRPDLIVQDIHADIDQRLLNAIESCGSDPKLQSHLRITASFVCQSFFDGHGIAMPKPSGVTNPRELLNYYMDAFDRLRSGVRVVE
jgi:hypothetical protein